MKLLRALGMWLRVLGITVAVVAIGWLVAQYAFHLKFLNVQTGSMRPAFSPGDALVMRRVDPAELRVGMVVAYHSPRNAGELISHRIVRLNTAHGSFQTKGDTLSAADPAVGDNLLVGRVVAVLPHMGTALGWLQSWPGLIACIYLPAATITLQELYRLEKRYHQMRVYHLRGNQVI